MTQKEHRKRPPRIGRVDRALFQIVNARLRLVQSPITQGNLTPKEALVDVVDTANNLYAKVGGQGRRSKVGRFVLHERHVMAVQRVEKVCGDIGRTYTGYAVERPDTAEIVSEPADNVLNYEQPAIVEQSATDTNWLPPKDDE